MGKFIKSRDYTPKGSTSAELMEEIKKWAAGSVRRFSRFERNKDYIYFEHHSLPSLIKSYIHYFNENVKESGDGFISDWDPDDVMSLLYKDGTIRTVSPECDEGTKPIKVKDIDSIVVSGSWGVAFAGHSITFEDYTVYEDIPDIRVEFDC